jgi:hypothetical protein
MKTYKAYATITYELEYTFELEDDEDAWDYAKDLDGGDFEEIPNSGEWNIYEVVEIDTKDKLAVQ